MNEGKKTVDDKLREYCSTVGTTPDFVKNPKDHEDEYHRHNFLGIMHDKIDWRVLRFCFKFKTDGPILEARNTVLRERFNFEKL